MEAIILAGGLGTRLKALVADVPKPMARIGDKPFLAILLGRLAKQGFSKIILSVGYLAESIQAYFGDSFENMRLVYSLESQPLGTGGALKQALTYVDSDHVFVFNGDTYIDVDIQQLTKKWQAYKTAIIVVRKVAEVARYGSLVVEDDKIVDFQEKSGVGAGLINAGCYVFPRSLQAELAQISLVASLQPFSLEQDYLLPAIKRGQKFLAFVATGRFIDIGVPEDYLRAGEVLKDIV